MNHLLPAMEANTYAYMAYFAARLPGMTVLDAPDMLLIDSGLPSDMFNIVCRGNFAAETLDGRIDFAIEHFRSRGLPFAWWVGPGAQPPALPQALERHGLKQVESDLGMSAELHMVPDTLTQPPGLHIRRLTEPDELAAFASVLAVLFTPPDAAVRQFFARAAPLVSSADCPMRFYGGFLDGEMVATSTAFYHAGVMGIYNVATLEKARRRGYGTAMTHYALLEGRREGYETATLQASEDGQGLYARLGFAPRAVFRVYQQGTAFM
jgi:ribosomal protein S18 acetylase RimI-like enzyme